MAENQNNGLYFVVGALIVAVLVLGYVYVQDNTGENVAVIETSAGDEPKSSFNLEISDDKVGVTSEQN